MKAGFQVGVTTGEGCCTIDDFKCCAQNGVDLVRINLASTKVESLIGRIYDNIHSAYTDSGISPNILFDLPYPRLKMRYRTYRQAKYPVKTGDRIKLVPNAVPLDCPATIAIDSQLFPHIEEGSRVYTGDGEIEYRVTDKAQKSATLEATNDWFISDSKALLVKGKAMLIDSPAIENFQALIEQYRPSSIALSFVESAQEIVSLRDLAWLDQMSVFAKIETSCGAANIDSISAAADSIVVARGDLALYAGIENMGRHQMEIINACNQLKKPVLVATEIFTSLKDRPVPLRSELSDFHFLKMAIGNGGILLTKESSMPGSLQRVLPIVSQLM